MARFASKTNIKFAIRILSDRLPASVKLRCWVGDLLVKTVCPSLGPDSWGSHLEVYLPGFIWTALQAHSYNPAVVCGVATDLNQGYSEIRPWRNDFLLEHTFGLTRVDSLIKPA